ncbi:FMRFamide receptor-like [Brachionus plicatilis]|uniref:FMRFamide receptor-like n=1 Tax=Brachionus plicatilis TaxID=10195 RepID=A0A3M7R8L1_BRAPC|nr:FMRFamide receptor-like [Brachionus plicatilis]
MENEYQVEFEIASYIYKTFTVIFLLIGSATNILSAFVYSRKKMRRSSYSVYLFALAIVDLCVTVNGNSRILLMSFELDFLKPNHVQHQKPFSPSSSQQIFKGFDIRETSLTACRIHRFLTYYFLQLSSVILCLLSIDRFFGCVLVLKSSFFCKPSMARKIIISAMIALLIFNSHFLAFMGHETHVTVDTNSSLKIIQCQPSNSSKFYHSIWNFYFYADSLVYCIIPFIVMITCNISIIAKIISSRIRSKKVVIAKNKSTNQKSIVTNNRTMSTTERRVSFILIFISISFLILTIPVFIFENLISRAGWRNPRLEVALAISYMLMYSNHVINFFFYFSLGPNFRREVKKLFPFLFSNKIDPIRASRLNTAQFGASGSANLKKFISKGDAYTFNNTAYPSMHGQNNKYLAPSPIFKLENCNEPELQVLFAEEFDESLAMLKEIDASSKLVSDSVV